jgi:hypothetical protein
MDLTPPSLPRPPDPHFVPPNPQRAAGWITLAGGAACGAAAVAFGLVGLQSLAAFDRSDQTDVAAHDRAVTFRTLANVGWGIAAVAGVTGLILLLTAPKGQVQRSSAALLAPWLH